QVATGILSEGAIAPPPREILRGQCNAQVQLGELIDIDIESRTVTSWTPSGTQETPYDSLIVAAGSSVSYFGHNHFVEHAPGMKSLDDALELRGRILSTFECAEIETEPDATAPWLTFVVVRAGPLVSRWRGRSPSWRTVPRERTTVASTLCRRGSCCPKVPLWCSARSGNTSRPRPPKSWSSSGSRDSRARR